jgi:prepilin signal peptidase PulO-like enzyme (type II secretory pathway)
MSIQNKDFTEKEIQAFSPTGHCDKCGKRVPLYDLYPVPNASVFYNLLGMESLAE